MNFFIRLFFSTITTFFAGIPLWIFLLANHFLSPEGFWQKIVLTGIGLWIGGSIQLFLIVVWAMLMIGIWAGELNS